MISVVSISVVSISVVDSESELESDDDDSSLLDELSLEVEAGIGSSLGGLADFRMLFSTGILRGVSGGKYFLLFWLLTDVVIGQLSGVSGGSKSGARLNVDGGLYELGGLK